MNGTIVAYIHVIPQAALTTAIQGGFIFGVTVSNGTDVGIRGEATAF
jgi:hypothetical protein